MVSYVIALYIRLSTEDSKVGSLSIGGQKHILHGYVDSMEGMENAEVLEFVDNGYTGTNFERPAVQELLDMVREGKINCIIVKDFTRFGRNSIEVGYFIERVFPIYHVRFISIGDDFDSDKFQGDTGGINIAFKYLISEYYSRDLSMKYKSAKYVKFRRGEYQSAICIYGYQKGTDGRLEPDEKTAPNVRLIFELAQEGCSTRGIVKELFNRGILTPAEERAARGFTGYDVSRCCGIWDEVAVRRILGDERYIGTYIIGMREVTEVGGHHTRLKDESEWIKIPNHHVGIVSKELFEAVQAKLPHFKSVKQNKTFYPLRSKVFCGCCRHAMVRTAAKNHRFICRYTRVDETAPCHGLRIAEAELEKTLYEILSRQAKIILRLDRLANVELLDVQLAKQEDCGHKIESYLDKKRVLYEGLVLRKVSMEEYRAQKSEIDKELDRLKKIHAALAEQTAHMQMAEKTKSARVELAQKISGEDSLTAELADALIDRVYVYPGNQVEIVWKVRDFYQEDV